MTSNINPNNIDGTYPVAGQDNNSQGFRDNFTNTKTNFQYASDEITDLQSKVIVSQQLTGGSALATQNNMLGSPIIDATIKDFSATRVALGSLSGSVTIDYSAGHYQTVSTAGSISLAFTNFPASGSQGWVTVRVTVTNTAYTVTLPAAVGTGASAKSVIGIEGISSNIITFAQTGTYELQFHTDDGGSTVYLSELTRPRNYFTNGVLSSSPTSGIGYTTGAGSTVAQGTSRTTGVTINAVSGAITLFSAAGTSSYTTFTVTNSAVAATDVIIVNQKSGTDKYETFITNVSAGSFNITFSDVSGTTTEQPVFNFAVIKGVTA